MGTAKTTYKSELRKTEHGSRLYAYWLKIRHNTDSPKFVEFPGFYKWAMENEYTVGAKLCRYEEDEPFSPDNCFWVPREEWVNKPVVTERNPKWEREWDEVVNRIREHYGMEPIYSSGV